MRTHDLKIWPEPFQAIVDNIKKFEFRKNDRGYRVGDHLILQEWNPDDEIYTSRKQKVEITYILQDRFELGEGLCIMSIKKI